MWPNEETDNERTMIARLKERVPEYPDLTPHEPYFVIGIEDNDLRILNDVGKPYLHASHLFEIVDSREPGLWITEYGDDGERYSYLPALNEAGFFEDFFGGKEEAVAKFRHVINKQLSEAA